MVHIILVGNTTLRSDRVACIVSAIFPVEAIVNRFTDLFANFCVAAIVIGAGCPHLRWGLRANFCVEELVSGL